MMSVFRDLAARPVRILGLFSLVLVLASISHRSSPVLPLELSAHGSTPRPSRRAHPNPTLARRVVEADREDARTPLGHHACPVMAERPYRPAGVRAVDAAFVGEVETTPDYLKLFKSSHPRGFLSPPA